MARGLKMAGAAGSSPGVGQRTRPPPPAEVEAVAADWMLEFACYCLCRHFGEESSAEFRRWRDVAQGEGWRRRRLSGLGGCGRGRPWLSDSRGRSEGSAPLRSVRGSSLRRLRKVSRSLRARSAGGLSRLGAVVTSAGGRGACGAAEG